MFPFYHPILLWCIRTTCLMINSIFLIDLKNRSLTKFIGIIKPKSLNGDTKLSFDPSIELFKDINRI